MYVQVHCEKMHYKFYNFYVDCEQFMYFVLKVLEILTWLST